MDFNKQIVEDVRSRNAVLIDVREPYEFDLAHAENALLIPLGEIAESDLDGAEKNQRIYLYCNSGSRSGTATEMLKSRGYTNVRNIGGLMDWHSIGGKVIQK
jgi:phage shock protein E